MSLHNCILTLKTIPTKHVYFFLFFLNSEEMEDILDKVEQELLSLNYGSPNSPANEASWTLPFVASTPKTPTTETTQPILACLNL